MMFTGRWFSLALGGLILAGVMVDRMLFQVPAADSYPYHARVRAAADRMPMQIGDWAGQDVPVRASAQKLLRSNVIVSRTYTNRTTRQSADFLLVQCSDARDLSGHYPPICYPASGFVLGTDRDRPQPRTWTVGDLEVEGTMYTFSKEYSVQGAQRIKVYNFMILPDGKTSPKMDGVDRIARNRSMRCFGAAQIQVITDLGMSEADRTQAISLILGAAKPLIQAIMNSGVAP